MLNKKTSPPVDTKTGNKRQILWKDLKRDKLLYLLLILPITVYVLFYYKPMFGLQIAFKNYNVFQGISESPWVGLKWFRILFESRDFYNILRNTLAISFLDLIFTFFGSIAFAILINEIQNKKYKRVIQTVSYLPHFLSWVVVGGLIIQLLSSDSFLVRTVANILNVAPQNILLEQKYFFPVIVAGEMWKSIGWGTILFLAAMSGISPELYEAAKMDGAGKFRQIWHITLPGIKFIMVIQLLMRIGGIMNVGFEKVFVLQNSMILDVAEVFSTYNYKVGIGQWNMSFSSALSFFESLTNFILVFVFDRIAKLLGEEGLL